MQTPQTKLAFKKLINSKVVDYWESYLRAEAAPLTLLLYYEVSKAIIQCRMLSGQYWTNKLSSYWSESGDTCSPASCCEAEAETLEHLLLICPAYASTRAGLVQKWKSVQNPAVSVLANTALTRPPPYLMQFLLDATVLPDIIAQVQSAGEGILSTLFSLTRTWC